MVAGARDYVPRPLDARQLHAAVVNVCAMERKRRLRGNSSGDSEQDGHIVVVFGAKGGIGRTTVASNLAVALAQGGGQRVALVDLDLQLGDVALTLDIPPERTFADLLPIIDKLDAELMRSFLCTHSSGLHVLPAPARPEDGEHIQASHVRQVLSVLARAYDYVIVDTPRQINDNVVAALDMSSTVCLVASNQLACLKSTRLCLDMMKGWNYDGDKVKLVINQAHNGSGLPVKDTQLAIDYPIYWKIPYDGHLVGASQWGQPFVQASRRAKLSQNIERLARTLSGTPLPRRGLLARIRR
jgi:pilus assembly protein CpaE